MFRFHYHPLPFLCAAALFAGCDDGHDKGSGTTDTATHGTTHGSSSGDDSSTSAPTSTEPTTASTTGTTAPVMPPAAPTDLAAGLLEGGVHLTWKDVSDNEENFVLENKAAGEVDFKIVIELPFDSVTYHDIAVTSGTEYTYRVKAVNAGGESPSNEVVIQVP